MTSELLPPTYITDGPSDARMKVALAHGAGQGMEAPFMRTFAEGLAARGLRVVRFEFPYMAATRATGRRRPPDGLSVLQATWVEVIRTFGPGGLIIGGKSMGGRIASLIADQARVAGLLCLGYPFHPAGRPAQLRTGHLGVLRTPTLICQGTRDAFGGMAEVEGYHLSPAIRVHWLPDGDHGFKPRKKSGRTEMENIAMAIEASADFATALATGSSAPPA
jgi:hypothetical protein